MIRPLRLTLPQDSLPYGAIDFQANAIVRNNATGLNVADQAAISNNGMITTVGVILCAGYNLFSVVALVNLSGGPTGQGVEFALLPISPVNQALVFDEISMGEIVGVNVSGLFVYQRASVRADGLFAFSLRMRAVGGTAIIDHLSELQLSKI